jgi:hypothetical protein
MLIILNDPAGVTGIKRHAFDHGVTLQANIERHLTGGADAELRINGQKVDPLTDPRLDMAPFRDDVVTVTLRPAGWEAVFAFIAENWIAITAATLSLYSLTVRANVPGADAAGNDSPNNRLTGQTNVARTYQGIPDVYGMRRVWPDLIQPSIVEYIDQIKYVTEWMCISRGVGVITDVRYSETPIADIDGSSFEVFEPTPLIGGTSYPDLGQCTIDDVYETFASDEVNGQEIPYRVDTASVSKSGNYSTVNGATTFTAAFGDGANLAGIKALAGTSNTVRVQFTYGSSTINFDEITTIASYTVSGGIVTFVINCAPLGETATGTFSFTFTPQATSYTTCLLYTSPSPRDH